MAMITLDRLEGKLDALLREQERQWQKLLEFEKQCANAIRLLGNNSFTRFDALDAALKGTADGIGSEVGELRQRISLLHALIAKPKKRAKK